MIILLSAHVNLQAAQNLILQLTCLLNVSTNISILIWISKQFQKIQAEMATTAVYIGKMLLCLLTSSLHLRQIYHSYQIHCYPYLLLLELSQAVETVR